jgi:hypothetical protein
MTGFDPAFEGINPLQAFEKHTSAFVSTPFVIQHLRKYALWYGIGSSSHRNKDE